MAHVHLLKSLPRGKRNIQSRQTAKTADHIRISRQYAEDYFDGSRDYGYGGYRYDGRWKPVARDIIEHFSLKPGDRLLDVGCAKGFLVKDLLELGIDAFGLDISEYALMHAEAETIGRLHLGNALSLPFPDNSFKAVLSVNTIHNLPREQCIEALREIQRVSQGNTFVQVDSYETPEEKAIFESWVLTAEFYGYPDEWKQLFEEAGYEGDFDWTIIS